MKRCPTCNRTFDDNTLSFCLEDGTPLLTTGAPAAFDPNATISFDQARQTSEQGPPPTIAYTGSTPLINQPLAGQVPTPSWTMPATPVAQARRRRVWPWVLGGLAILTVLGVGFIILLVALANMDTNTNTANVNTNNSNTNRNANSVLITNRNSNTNTTANSNTNSNKSLAATFSDDFSEEKWGSGTSSYGRIWYQDDEYRMHANSGGYIVMYGPNGDYSTENATVRATARSINGISPSAGYGLVVHGEKSEGKQELEDYAFLIFTGENPQYTVVMHRGGTQTTLVKWTRSSVIRTGTSPNQLEARIKDKQLSFYVNGQYLTSITDTGNFQRGLAGFYTSDTPEVAFDDLEINR
jgi:hypothetical protein